MSVQDDKRENQLRKLFHLEKRDESRIGTDAVLDLDGVEIPFELKSTTTDSVTTARDFGKEHIRKWKNKHWLIGFYDKKQELERCLYGSPETMAPWIKSIEEYIKPDIQILEGLLRPGVITLPLLYKILGQQEVYDIKDAIKIQKRQFSNEQYKKMMDVFEDRVVRRNKVIKQPIGYSRQRMLEILELRCRYLVDRGSTLNNPHINAKYFTGEEGPGTDLNSASWKTVDLDNPAEHLKELVKEALQQKQIAFQIIEETKLVEEITEEFLQQEAGEEDEED